MLLTAIMMTAMGLLWSSQTDVQAQTITNLALFRETTQGIGNALPSHNAVDGNTSGNYLDGIHTGRSSTDEIPAYWQVNLEAPANITEVTIWNRTDCCMGSLTDIHIFVSDVPFEDITLASSLNQAGVSDFFISGSVGENMTVPINRTGRYIRVQKSTAGDMTFAEFHVFGTHLPNNNLDDLHAHVLGNTTLSVQELNDLTDYFAFQKVLIDGQTTLQLDFARLGHALSLIHI